MSHHSRVPLSLEFFPAKNPENAAKLRSVRENLYPLGPEFCSVTYGAGGSTQQGTFGTLREMLAEGANAASHFSCIGASKATVREQLAELRAMGVRRIVALRGDLPAGYEAAGDFRYASDLVAFIRAEMGDIFSIEVAAYPETHPQAANPRADLDALAAKARAGANSAITQYFFNPDAYFRFRDDVEAMGLHIPIVPGIMPVSNFQSVTKIAGLCGSKVPSWFANLFDGLDDDVETRRMIAATVAGDLCRRLHAEGVDRFHFYTLNRADLTFAICHLLGVRPHDPR